MNPIGELFKRHWFEILAAIAASRLRIIEIIRAFLESWF